MHGMHGMHGIVMVRHGPSVHLAMLTFFEENKP
jgi:hypothetical protein